MRAVFAYGDGKNATVTFPEGVGLIAELGGIEGPYTSRDGRLGMPVAACYPSWVRIERSGDASETVGYVRGALPPSKVVEAPSGPIMLAYVETDTPQNRVTTGR